MTFGLTRGPLHENVSEALRELIVSGELEPGTKVREGELSKRFAISRTPLREALKILAVEGLIELRPRRGAYIAKISPKEIDELFPIIAALESLAGELACERFTNEDIREFQQMHDEMFDRHIEGKEAEYLRLNKRIHQKFFQIANNQALTTLYVQMLVRIHAVRFVARKSPQQWLRAVRDHKAILRAIEARNGKRLAALLKQHLLHTAADIARSSIQ